MAGERGDQVRGFSGQRRSCEHSFDKALPMWRSIQPRTVDCRERDAIDLGNEQANKKVGKRCVAKRMQDDLLALVEN